MTEEEESNIDEALEILTLAYIASLSKAALKTQMSSSLEAVNELNSVRVKEGLEPVKIPAKTLSKESIISVAKYEKMLKERGGSFVVDNDKKFFSPWLKKLKTDTKEELVTLFDQAAKESWTPEKLKTELKGMEELAKNVKAYNAAYCETRVLQDDATRRTWEYGGLEEVQWHTRGDNRVRPTHEARDRQVYPLKDCPSLGEPGCRCIISPYITKYAKY